MTWISDDVARGVALGRDRHRTRCTVHEALRRGARESPAGVAARGGRQHDDCRGLALCGVLQAVGDGTRGQVEWKRVTREPDVLLQTRHAGALDAGRVLRRITEDVPRLSGAADVHHADRARVRTRERPGQRHGVGAPLRSVVRGDVGAPHRPSQLACRSPPTVRTGPSPAHPPPPPNPGAGLPQSATRISADAPAQRRQEADRVTERARHRCESRM